MIPLPRLYSFGDAALPLALNPVGGFFFVKADAGIDLVSFRGSRTQRVAHVKNFPLVPTCNATGNTGNTLQVQT